MHPPIQRLSLAEFERHTDDYDRLVAASNAIDPFCSSSTWVLSAHEAFAPGRRLWIVQSPAGFVLFALGLAPGLGMILEPLESVWGLASPFVARDPDALIETFLSAYQVWRRGPRTLFVSGLVRGSSLERKLVSRLKRHALVLSAPGVRVLRASLEGGVDGFLARRRRKFRANLRRAVRAAGAQDIHVIEHPAPASLQDAMQVYDRVLQVERRSRKGAVGSGLIDPGMEVFYRAIVRRTWHTGTLRFLFAKQDGQDVGYLFGVLQGTVFRGLQASYDDRHASLSLGSLLHWCAIRRLCEQGVQWYDMGTFAPYKLRWAEGAVDYAQFLAI